LPYADIGALLGVIAVLSGHLMAGELSPDLTRDLIRRLTERGPLPADSTAGTLNATLADLAQRLHWASGGDLEYPVGMPHRTSYLLAVPADSVAACIAALVETGGEDIHDVPYTESGWEMRPTGIDGALERHSTDIPNSRTIVVAFPELAPDPAYRQRIGQLSALAERFGGRYQGAH
jgi:hypothetical protein